MNSESAKKSGVASILGLALLLFLFPSRLTLAQSGKLPEVQTYDELVRAIRDLRQATHPENKHEIVSTVTIAIALFLIHLQIPLMPR